MQRGSVAVQIGQEFANTHAQIANQRDSDNTMKRHRQTNRQAHLPRRTTHLIKPAEDASANYCSCTESYAEDVTGGVAEGVVEGIDP